MPPSPAWLGQPAPPLPALLGQPAPPLPALLGQPAPPFPADEVPPLPEPPASVPDSESDEQLNVVQPSATVNNVTSIAASKLFFIN